MFWSTNIHDWATGLNWICVKEILICFPVWCLFNTPQSNFDVVWLLSHVWLFATSWTATHQASLSFIVSRSLLNLRSIESMMPSNRLIPCTPFYSCPQSFPASESFQMSQLFTSGNQSTGVSVSTSVLPMNIQGWFHFSLTVLISLLLKGLLRVFSSTTFWKLQFFSTQPSLWSNSHIWTWLLERPKLQLYRPLSAKWYLCFLISCLGLS